MNSYLRLSSPALSYLLWLIDVLLLCIIGLGAAHIYLGDWNLPFDLTTVYPKIIVLAAFMLGLFSSRIYRSWRTNSLWDILTTVSWVWLTILLLLTLVLFLLKVSIEVSRIWFLIWGGGCWVVLILNRLLIYSVLHWLRRWGYNFKTLLIVGHGQISDRVMHEINNSSWSGLKVVGLIPLEELDQFMKLPLIDQPNEIWICLPISDEPSIRQVLTKLRHSVANIRLVPDLFSLNLINHGISQSLGITMFDLSMSPVTGTTRIIKKMQDIILGSIILISISPIIGLIALFIKLTSNGPVFFKQKRMGWNGLEINIYKFRTMYDHQETELEITQAHKNDKRVTNLGRFLRKTSLDELPQFINVLQGRMSIVGPRPHAMAHNEIYKELVPGYMLRHKVKPGITGWAQIHGYRGETDQLVKMEKRVEYDKFYIENMSLGLDLKIIFVTLFTGFLNKNAY
jgi:putative colanic acid biosynthesis UDP-glucose lipid carrier transferase